MPLQLVNSSRARIRLPVAAFTALCGAATAAGSLLTWLTARGARPRMGMAHTSLRQMLVYSFANTSPFWTSAGFAVLLLGVLMVIGALAGLRTLTALAALLALAAAGMWIGLDVHHYNTPNLPNPLRQPGEFALVRPTRRCLANDNQCTARAAERVLAAAAAAHGCRWSSLTAPARFVLADQPVARLRRIPAATRRALTCFRGAGAGWPARRGGAGG
ncbi:MAG: hypothetical protein ACM3ML_04775 [Micromonosporaceae bacterium]